MNIPKKYTLLILLLLLTIGVLTSATKSPLFSKNVMITRIYPHQLGYRVIYLANTTKYKEIYLPLDLFKGDGKSSVIYGTGKSYPYMQIFWNDGQFSHVKIFVNSDYKDVSWGTLNNPEAYNENFSNMDIKFDF